MQTLTNSDAMTSALAEHAMDTMHEIAWEDAEVLSLVGGGGGGGGRGAGGLDLLNVLRSRTESGGV